MVGSRSIRMVALSGRVMFISIVALLALLRARVWKARDTAVRRGAERGSSLKASLALLPLAVPHPGAQLLLPPCVTELMRAKSCKAASYPDTPRAPGHLALAWRVAPFLPLETQGACCKLWCNGFILGARRTPRERRHTVGRLHSYQDTNPVSSCKRFSRTPGRWRGLPWGAS